MTVAERLATRTVKSSEPDGCWVYEGGYTSRSGHKQMWAVGHMRAVHRVAWELANGPIPEGICVCHRCDNPPCVRPDHLFLGTVTDNNDDRDQKGRQVALKGEAHGNAKLTERQAAGIKALIEAGIPYRIIAAAAGVKTAAVAHIGAGKAWRHVDATALTPTEHGTLRSYNDGCRCPECRAAMSAYRRGVA